MEYLAKPGEKEKFINDTNKKWIKREEVKKRDGSIEVKYDILPMELANFIKANLKYIFVKNAASEQPLTYVYSDGYYKEVSEDEMKGFIKSFIPYQLRHSKDINEVLFDIKTELKFVEHEDLNSCEDLINFEDGLLNIKTWELLPHSPDVLSTIQIPAKYSEIKGASTDIPVFMKYMNTLCDSDLQTFELLMQCLGLAISNIYAYRTKKALFLVGQGNTGKSQLKKLAEYLIGYKNVSNIDLKKISDKHGTSSLYQKRLSGCNDMSYQRIEDMSIFKQLTGGDSIEVNFKFKNSFNFMYKGFLWFNCNKLPFFGGDTGKWVYERIMPVFCNNVISKEEQDPLLFEKMLKEKNGILSLALTYLKKLIDNDYKFIEPDNMKELREKYEVENNTFLSFLEDCCDYRPDGGIIASMRLKRSTFKEAYTKYVDINNNGKGKLTTNDMNKILKERYNETFVKSNGVIYLKDITLSPEAIKELGVWRTTLYKLIYFFLRKPLDKHIKIYYNIFNERKER